MFIITKYLFGFLKKYIKKSANSLAELADKYSKVNKTTMEKYPIARKLHLLY